MMMTNRHLADKAWVENKFSQVYELGHVTIVNLSHLPLYNAYMRPEDPGKIDCRPLRRPDGCRP